MIRPDDPHEPHPYLRNVGRTGPDARWDYITSKMPPSGMACWSRFCRGKRSLRRRGRICSKCFLRLDRLNNPLRAAFAILRDNAKRRGKPFDLTLADFRQFCEDHGYLEGKGRHAGALHIDRIDPLKGYTRGNVTVLECVENSAKGAVEDKLRHRYSLPPQYDPENTPF